MVKMAKQLAAEQFQVYNLDYPSTSFPIAKLVDIVADLFPKNLHQQRTLYIVGLSLGAIITHLYLKKYQPNNLGRVVALGPPFHGSPIIDHLGRYQWYRQLHGPAALELTTLSSSICHQLGPADYPLGVIAGNRYHWVDTFFANCWLKKPNDGKVEVNSTRIEGCQDHIILPVNHIHLPQYPEVIKQTIFFLKNGIFCG